MNAKIDWNDTQTRILIGTAAALVLVIGLAVLGTTFPDTVGQTLTAIAATALWLAVVALGLMVWLLPIFIASKRNHASINAIALVTILGGLCCALGWIWGLIWSLTDPSPKSRDPQIYINTGTGTITTAPPVQYQVGDVVNGHRFNGVEWVKL